MIDILAPVLLLTILGYLLHRLVKSPFLHSPRRGLPAHRLTRPDEGSEWAIEREGWTVSLSTTALNNLPAVLVKGQSARIQTVLRLAYDAGILACTVGAVVGVGGAMWSTLAVWKEVWREAELHARLKSETAYVVERSLDAAAGSAERYEGSAGIEPLIPGVTIPFSHLPTLALAFVVNQIVHELGHALSGALDEVQMSRFSFNLHAILPSATVSFPSTLDSLTTRAKLRITTAGASHNLATYLVLFLLGSSGVQHLFWADRSALGTTVQRVSPTSPLYGHLKPGDLITHVDDVFMGEDDDAWKRYLDGTVNGDEGKGWCVDRNVYAALSAPPCTAGSGTVAFEPVDPASPGAPKRGVKCLQTHPLLQIPASHCPCPSAKWLCVHPRHEEQVLRIRVARKRRADGDEGVILFAGERKEVLEGVQVGKMGTRFMGGLVRWQSMFLEYMSIVAFSLFIFNLLPIPYTDGSTLLRHLLSLYRSPRRSDSSFSQNPTTPGLSSSSKLTTRSAPNTPMKATLASTSTLASKAPSINLSRQYELNSDDEDDYDPEQGDERGDRKKEEGWKRRTRRGVEGGMMVVGAAWVAGWAMLSLLRSS